MVSDMSKRIDLCHGYKNSNVVLCHRSLSHTLTLILSSKFLGEERGADTGHFRFELRYRCIVCCRVP